MARYSTANDIINRVAVECGLLKDSNPVSSNDESFIQLTELFNAAGQELVELYPWQTLVKTHSITTLATDTGDYTLPDDFSYMIQQTGWESTNTTPLGGPLSAQDWTYLKGRDEVSDTIYASFRLMDNKFSIFPQDPVPGGLEISFEYISRNWITEAGTGSPNDHASQGADFVNYEAILIQKFLRVKFLSSKGFDTAAALTEFELMFNSRTGKDRGGSILSAGGDVRGYPYLSGYRNVGDTNYGF